MTTYTGVTISGSISIGRIKKYLPNIIQIPQSNIDSAKTDYELQNLKSCIAHLESEYGESLLNTDLTQLDRDILNTHQMILTDIEIFSQMETAILLKLMTAPQAVYSTFEQIISDFEKMDNDYFAQRADDYKDVENKLIKCLLGINEDIIDFSADEIVFVHEITPSLVSVLAQKGIKAYCSEKGSYTSHSAILTRAKGLTAIIAKEPVLQTITDGDTAILDAEESAIIINPGKVVLADYVNKLKHLEEKSLNLKALLSEPAQTKNGVHISLKANIEYPDELSNVLDNRCEGIGLFRTEFLYLDNQILPNEDKQTQIYSDILKGSNGLPVTFRTFDLGGDKLTHLIQSPTEENPYLGSRGIRFSLQHLALFKTQIRAILKSSVHGKAKIMFPMIIGIEDFRLAKTIVEACYKELHVERIDYDRDIPVGVMIETPSAALCSALLAKECSFFSIGTNDLVQYTLAVDRNNENVAQYYVQHHPAVLMLIQQSINSARRAGIPISVCGEMASDPKMVPLLIGMGIDELSVNPLQAMQIKAVIRKCDERLFEIISRFDFNTDINTIDYLLETLKPYYTI